MNTVPASDWLAIISARLQQRWPTIDAARLDDVAHDLWRDERLRTMRPEDAAEEWLKPVSSGGR
jgi:hypothetical protein